MKAQFIRDQYVESYQNIKSFTAGINHKDSVWQPPFGGNSVNWIMGHLVVSRCNFLMLLDVPSVWPMDQCLRYIPGSKPVSGENGCVPFDEVLSAFDRTQEQLVTALDSATPKELAEIKDDRTVAESLVYYLSHESQHAGQLEILCVLARY
ncbi:MAG: DinB family protein [Candidatus Promineifilaceae bacterium]|jgi:hypothetical protein